MSEFFEHIEQYHCPTCQGAIAKECVAGNLVRETGLQLPRRVVKVFCEHCGKLFTAKFVLSGGVWAIDGQPGEITDARQIESFQKRIAHVRGESLVASC